MSQSTEEGVRGRARAWERVGTRKDLVGPVGAGQGLHGDQRKVLLSSPFPLAHPLPAHSPE